ncbi:MAG: DUF4124 domain-containing protein, partial [Cytophagales bacterium]|nr:DUF4124 domain-containing protein [Rhizobacter sp.]
MKALKTGACAAMVVLASLATGSAFGQGMYRCNSGGTTHWSDRPCAPGADTRITNYGPVRTPEARPSYTPSLQKAPDHLPYLSGSCAELNDAIRTAPARGVGRSTQSELREEYQRKCSEDEEAARKRVMDDRRQQRDERKAEINSRQAELARTATAKEQCSELFRILREKRTR